MPTVRGPRNRLESAAVESSGEVGDVTSRANWPPPLAEPRLDEGDVRVWLADLDALEWGGGSQPSCSHPKRETEGMPSVMRQIEAGTSQFMGWCELYWGPMWVEVLTSWSLGTHPPASRALSCRHGSCTST